MEKAIPRSEPRPKRIPCIAFGAASGVLLTAPAQAAGALELIPDWFGLLPLLVAAFAVLILPVNLLIFKPIFRALDERTARIEGGRRRAESLRVQTEDVLARYESSIRKAWSEAETSRKQQAAGARAEQALLAAATRAEAEQKIEWARAELAAARAVAVESLRASARELSRAAAERVLGRPLS